MCHCRLDCEPGGCTPARLRCALTRRAVPLPLPFAEVGTLRRQLADAQSVDSGDLQRRLKDVTDMLYLKQTQVWAVCGGGWAGGVLWGCMCVWGGGEHWVFSMLILISSCKHVRMCAFPPPPPPPLLRCSWSGWPPTKRRSSWPWSATWRPPGRRRPPPKSNVAPPRGASAAGIGRGGRGAAGATTAWCQWSTSERRTSGEAGGQGFCGEGAPAACLPAHVQRARPAVCPGASRCRSPTRCRCVYVALAHTLSRPHHPAGLPTTTAWAAWSRLAHSSSTPPPRRCVCGGGLGLWDGWAGRLVLCSLSATSRCRRSCCCCVCLDAAWGGWRKDHFPGSAGVPLDDRGAGGARAAAVPRGPPGRLCLHHLPAPLHLRPAAPVRAAGGEEGWRADTVCVVWKREICVRSQTHYLRWYIPSPSSCAAAAVCCCLPLAAAAGCSTRRSTRRCWRRWMRRTATTASETTRRACGAPWLDDEGAGKISSHVKQPWTLAEKFLALCGVAVTPRRHATPRLIHS